MATRRTAVSEIMSFAHPRWAGVKRPYTEADVAKLAGSLPISHTVADVGSRKLWHALQHERFIPCLGAQTGMQAVQQVKAGIKAIYVSGWQVAADANTSGHMYPDQSLYPCNSVPLVVERVSRSLRRADQLQSLAVSSGKNNAKKDIDFFVPIVADAEAGFGGPLNAHELMKAMIHAGAAGVHFEDQLSTEKKCGHLGGKVLVPVSQFIRTLNCARLAADVEGVPTVLIARTDAESAMLVTSDCDARDAPFLTGERTAEGFFRVKPNVGKKFAIERALSYAEHADVLWWETSTPCVKDAREFAEAVHAAFPGKVLAYNCSPSFNWATAMSPRDMELFQGRLGDLGYKYQFVTLAGFHSVAHTTFRLSREYLNRGMRAYAELQSDELALLPHGYTAGRHQQEVGTGYFDSVLETGCGGATSTAAMADSTESSQFSGGK